jgi:hypothetical protein
MTIRRYHVILAAMVAVLAFCAWGLWDEMFPPGILDMPLDQLEQQVEEKGELLGDLAVSVSSDAEPVIAFMDGLEDGTGKLESSGTYLFAFIDAYKFTKKSDYLSYKGGDRQEDGSYIAYRKIRYEIDELYMLSAWQYKKRFRATVTETVRLIYDDENGFKETASVIGSGTDIEYFDRDDLAVLIGDTPAAKQFRRGQLVMRLHAVMRALDDID